jgi:hypothetical protein
MKLGISMLVIGLLFAGFGFFLWNYAGAQGPFTSSWFSTYEEQSMAQAIGMGVTVFGGGLTIGGIVRMVVKR